MNPTLTLIFGALGGATLSGLVGLVVFILTGRREHKRWLYDLRYEKYLEALKVWQRWVRIVEASGRGSVDPEQAESVYHQMSELISADLLLLSSPAAEKKFTSLLSALHSQIDNGAHPTSSEISKEALEWIHAMRKDLNIRGTVTNGM